MDTAAKVGIGVALTVGAVAGIAALANSRKTLGRATGTKARGRLQPLSESADASGRNVRVFRGGKLPIKERLGILQDLVAKGVSGKDLPQLRALALRITKGCPARDDTCEAKAIYDWVRKNIRYTGDIAVHKVNGRKGPTESVDLFQTAQRTVEMGGGDCDDHFVLVATLAILNGIQAKMRVTSPYLWGKDNFTHIYPVLGLPKNDPRRWIAADTTLSGDRFGVEVPYQKKIDLMA